MDFLSLLPSFGSFFFTLAAFVVALSVIVAVHEYGHYIIGRLSGIHAEVFSIGFGPVLLKGTDRRGTQWQIAALPLGGYVKFAGDADAASAQSDADAVAAMDAQARRRTMAGAPLWARSATVAAGPMFNFIFAILVFGAFMMVRGVATDDLVVGEIAPLPSAGIELQAGDRILAIDGNRTATLTEFFATTGDIDPAPTVPYRVERGGQELEIAGPFPQPPLIGSVSPQSAARAAGLRAGDVVLSADGRELHAFSELREVTDASDGAPLSLEVWRAGEVFELEITPRRTDLPLPDGGFETRWLIGLTSGAIFEQSTRTPGLLEATSMAASQTWLVIRTSLEGLWYMVTGVISTCNIAGPIGIAEVSGAMASDGLADFIWFIAVLSVAVGLLNLFPIPILDGGHLVFHAWEAVTGKPPSERALRVLMTVGLTLLIMLMVFAVTNDLFC